MKKYLKEILKTDQDLLKSMYWLGGKRGKGSGLIPGARYATVILENHCQFSSDFYENSTIRFRLKVRIDWYIYH